MRNRTIGINVRVSENEKLDYKKKFIQYQMKNFVKFTMELLN